jgi:antitoxin component YwqK of YwqJK toxin-antitoxin module
MGQSDNVDFYKDINYKDVKEIKGLLHLKSDSTLVTGRVIRYNKKMEGKRYILVVNGKHDNLGWLDFPGKKNLELKESRIASIATATTGFIAPANSKVNGNEIGAVPTGRILVSQEIVQKYQEIVSNDRGNMSSESLPSQPMPLEMEKTKDGLYEEFHENNQLKSKGIFSDGKEVDLWESYHYNGQLESKANYINGLKDGLWERYYSNGKLKSKVTYIKGEKNGLCEEYYNGQLDNKVNYNFGQKEGVWVEFHENGQLWSRGKYLDGKKTGKWDYYNDKGEFLLSENYE